MRLSHLLCVILEATAVLKSAGTCCYTSKDS